MFAAAMVAWRELRSRIIRSFWSCLSACTVWACCRKLSRRENCLPQWQEKGRSPVCFRMCRARCSLLEKTIRHSPYPLHWNVFAGAGRYRFACAIEPGETPDAGWGWATRVAMEAASRWLLLLFDEAGEGGELEARGGN